MEFKNYSDILMQDPSIERVYSKKEAIYLWGNVFDGRIVLSPEDFEGVLSSLVSYGITPSKELVDQLVSLRIYQLYREIKAYQVAKALKQQISGGDPVRSHYALMMKFMHIKERWGTGEADLAFIRTLAGMKRE